MLDDKDLARAYLQGIQAGVDFVFQTLIEAGLKTFDLQHAERYRQIVREAVKDRMMAEKIPLAQ